MELEASPTNRLEGEVSSPPSKSYTHRAIMLAGLSRGSVKVKDPLLSADPLATIAAMRAAGAKIEERGDHLLVEGNGGEIEAPEKVDVKNSGTTIRIMASVFSLCDRKVILTGDESIRNRPMGPLLDALEGMRVETSSRNGNPPISVKGPMKGDTASIRGDVSSQYISGLLISCPLREEDTVVDITTPLKSKPYLDLTLDTINEFGVSVVNEDYKRFRMRGGQFYSRSEYRVEGDFSGAAFVLGASALTDSGVTVNNIYDDSMQGDKYFLDILKMMGAEVYTHKGGVEVVGGKSLRAVEVDLSQTPDLLPMTAVMCALAKGESRICNVEHARIKECDRISAMARGLSKMGAKIDERQDGMIIRGVDNLKGARIESFGDHRIVMAFAVAGLRAEGKTVINRAESVNVSYPGFVEDMKSLGANLSTSPGAP